jgi:RNA polymerase sigma factor (TIGR02999 family)
MRRILVERARRNTRVKHGGQYCRTELLDADLGVNSAPDELLMVDEALARLASEDPQGAEIVKLRYFAGMSVDEAATLLKMSRATAYRHWTYARAWIRSEILDDETTA